MDSKSKKEILIQEVDYRISDYLEEFMNSCSDYITRIKKAVTVDGNFSELTVSGNNFSKKIGYETLEQRAKIIFKTLDDLAFEKGFRENIKTYNEHKQQGSTIWDKYSEQPDVPIGILDKLWSNGKGQTHLSVDEARIAREIVGKPTIDEKGFSTGNINPEVRDTYHFLSPERREQVILTEKGCFSELGWIFVESFSGKNDLLESFKGFYCDFIEGKYNFKEAEEKVKEINAIADISLSSLIIEAKKFSYDEGYRNIYLTPQELTFLGNNYDEKYESRPHTPIGIQAGILDVEQANVFRSGDRSFIAITDLFTGFKRPLFFSLEQVGEDETTIKGVLPLDEGYIPWGEKHFEAFKGSIKNIPFSREQDRYHVS